MYLGTSVKIAVVLDTPLTESGDSATITIRDPSNIAVVSNAPMVREKDDVFYYIYQSQVTGVYGTYEAVVSIVSGGYTSLQIQEFELEEYLFEYL